MWYNVLSASSKIYCQLAERILFMSKNFFKPSNYDIKNAILDTMRYGDVYVGDNYVMKDHGDYVEVNIDANNAKGHISFDVYYDSNGRITRVVRHD